MNRANIAPGDLKVANFDKDAFQISPVTAAGNTLPEQVSVL